MAQRKGPPPHPKSWPKQPCSCVFFLSAFWVKFLSTEGALAYKKETKTVEKPQRWRNAWAAASGRSGTNATSAPCPYALISSSTKYSPLGVLLGVRRPHPCNAPCLALRVGKCELPACRSIQSRLTEPSMVQEGLGRHLGSLPEPGGKTPRA